LAYLCAARCGAVRLGSGPAALTGVPSCCALRCCAPWERPGGAHWSTFVLRTAVLCALGAARRRSLEYLRAAYCGAVRLGSGPAALTGVPSCCALRCCAPWERPGGAHWSTFVLRIAVLCALGAARRRSLEYLRAAHCGAVRLGSGPAALIVGRRFPGPILGHQLFIKRNRILHGALTSRIRAEQHGESTQWYVCRLVHWHPRSKWAFSRARYFAHSGLIVGNLCQPA